VNAAGTAQRLAEVCRRYRLDSDAGARLTTLLELVASDPHAPTTVRDARGILQDHIADSLVALELDAVRSAAKIADLGSGAGFPGLPLAIARPDARVTLVESNARKCEFIERAAAACGLANAAVVNARAEEWRDGIGSADLVTARALAALAVVAEYAAPLLRIGGTLVAWRGRRDPAGEASAAHAARELGLEPAEVLHVEPYVGAEHRHLHLFLKVSDTPPRFPRRPGVARRRPLGTPAGASDR
jgi:16S rRNA (guanine527-N7)-methyltransferase